MATRFGLIARSPEDMRAVGAALGRELDGPAVITLTGDLGAGKTCFVQGLACGLDVSPDYYVTSPSYTLINEYPGRRTLFHVDLYRLDGVDDAADIGLEDALFGDGVVAIEWPDRLPAELIAEAIEVRIEESPVNENWRQIEMAANGPETLTDCLKRLADGEECCGSGGINL